MRRVLVTIRSPRDREQLHRLVDEAPFGTRVEVKEQKRTLDQNNLMWALLTEVARHVPWHGVRLTPSDWKMIFLDGLKREVRIVQNLEGNGFVNLSTSSSDLSKAEMSDLVELIREFSARHGVPMREEEVA